MGQVIQVNGDYTIKARRAGGANVTFDTGNQIGSVTVTGDLHVLGTSHTFNTQVISDVVLVLNRGETGAGVTLGKSGLEVDRGSLERADFLFDETLDAWTISNKDIGGVYNYTNSNLLVRRILTDASTDNGDLTLISTGTGVVKVAGTTNYESRVLDYSKLPSIAIASISCDDTADLITVTTTGAHGISVNDYVDIHCATFPAFNTSNVLVLDVDPIAHTFKYSSTGPDFATTPVSGYVIKNSLLWVDGSSYVPTDDYLPNIRAVSDYSRSLVNAAIDNFSTSHIEDQNSSVVVYDSATAGATSYVKFQLDGVDRIWVDSNGRLGIGTATPAYPLDVIATDIRIQSGTSTVKQHIGPQTNTGYLFGSSTEIGLASDTTSGGVVLSKQASLQYLTLNAGTGSSVIDMWTNDTKRASIDSTGKVFVNTSTGSSQFNISSSNEFGGTGYAGLFTLKNTVAGALLPSKHVKISTAGDFEIANDANTLSILKIADDGVVTFENGLNVKNYIRTTSTSFDLINANAATVNFAGAGTAIGIGANTGTVAIHNPTLAIGNGTGAGSISNITTPSETFNLVNGVATAINFAGAGTAIGIGANSGTLTVNNPTIAIGSGATSNITTPSATFNLVNTTATEVNIAGAGTLVNIGKTTGAGVTNLKNDTTNIGVGATLTVATPSTTVNLVDTVAGTVNFAGAGTAICIGATTGKTTIRNPEVAVGNGTTSSITTPATTFDLINTTATTVNFAGAATTISIGSALPGITTINHNLVVTGSLTVNGPSSSIGSSSLSVEDPMIYLGNNNPADSFDLGIVGGYNFGPPGGQYPTHPHTGLVRDASDNGIWKLFSGVIAEPTTTLDFTGATYDKLKIGDLLAVKGIFSSDVEAVKGIFTGDLSAVKGTFTGDVSGVKGIFSGDVSGAKGTFTGDVSGAKGTFTGKLTASGGADFTGTVTGITAAMVGAYTTATVDSMVSGITNALSGGSATITIAANTGSSVDLAATTGILPVSKGGTGVTDKTGSGFVVLNNGPQLISPTLGDCSATSINRVAITAPATSAEFRLADNSFLGTEGAFEMTLKTTANTIATLPEGSFTVGYVDMPQVIKNTQAGPGLTDVGKHWFHTDALPVTYNIDSAVDFPIGSVLTFINDTGAGDITITISGASLVLAGTGLVSSLSVKLAADGIATAIKTTASKWLINGVGLTSV